MEDRLRAANPRARIEGEIQATREKLAGFEKTRAANQRLVADCLAEKAAVLAQLREAGVKSGADLTDRPNARRHAEELLRLQKELEPLERFGVACEEGISRAKALIRRLEQSLVVAESGVSEQELAVLAAEVRNLDDTRGADAGPGVADPLVLDSLLEKELKGSVPATAAGGTRKADPPAAVAPPVPPTKTADPSEDDLAAKEHLRRLLGAWEVAEGPNKGATIMFRPDRRAVLTGQRTGFGPPNSLAEFEVRGVSATRVDLEFETTDAKLIGDYPHYAMAFLSDDELVLSPTTWKGKGPFAGLAGRLSRVRPGGGTVRPSASAPTVAPAQPTGQPNPPSNPSPEKARKLQVWTQPDPMPEWTTVWGKWSASGQTQTAAPDGAEHWKSRLLDKEFDTLRAVVAVHRPGKPDGWAAFDFGHRAWNDRESVVLYQKKVVVRRSRPDGKGGATITESLTFPLNTKAAASPWTYFRVEYEEGRVRVEGSSDGAVFHPVYEAPAGGYRPGRVGFSVREGGHGGEFRLVNLETRDAPTPVPPPATDKPR